MRTVIVVLLSLSLPMTALAEEPLAINSDVPAMVNLRPPRPTQGPFAQVERRNISRAPAIIATAITGALLVGTVASWAYHEHLIDDLRNASGFGEHGSRLAQEDRLEKASHWKRITLGMFATLVVSGGVTGYMWSRHETSPTINLSPTNSGIRVGYARSF